MTTEIGESLFYSWLRHVKTCQLVQTNWKPSATWRIRNSVINQIVEDVKKEFEEEDFKVLNNLKTSLLGTEIDVIGIATDIEVTDKIENKPTDKIITVDVAFHSKGLGYKKNVSKVISKFVRTALCIIAYFDRLDAELYFASPKINKKDLDGLESAIEKLIQIFNSKNCNFSFQLLEGEKFKSDVIEPLIKNSKDVNDQTELFLRSCRMLDMFDEIGILKTKIQNQGKKLTAKSSSFDNMRSGVLAKEMIPLLIKSGKVSSEEFTLMQKKEECRELFDVYFPVIVKVGDDFDDKRYYKNEFEFNGIRYRLCSQWYERNRRKLIVWLQNHHINEIK